MLKCMLNKWHWSWRYFYAYFLLWEYYYCEIFFENFEAKILNLLQNLSLIFFSQNSDIKKWNLTPFFLFILSIIIQIGEFSLTYIFIFFSVGQLLITNASVVECSSPIFQVWKFQNHYKIINWSKSKETHSKAYWKCAAGVDAATKFP